MRIVLDTNVFVSGVFFSGPPCTIRLARQTVEYSEELATDVGVPYHNLINLYPRDCVAKPRRLDPRWVPRPKSTGVSGDEEKHRRIPQYSHGDAGLG